MAKEKKQWETPDIESLEINAPKQCVPPFPQSEICLQQGEPASSTPCNPGSKGQPSQTLS